MDKKRVGKRAGIVGLYLLGAILGFKAPDFFDARKMRALQKTYDVAKEKYFGITTRLNRLNREIAKNAGLRFENTQEIEMHITKKHGISFDDIHFDRMSKVAKEEMEQETKKWLRTVQQEGEKLPEFRRLRAQLKEAARPYFTELKKYTRTKYEIERKPKVR